jgi:hypothetical protein
VIHVSQHPSVKVALHFSPEHGYSVLLRNVGMYLGIRVASQTKGLTFPSSAP